MTLKTLICDYLKTTLGVAATLRPWKLQAQLPLALRDSYDFYLADLLMHQLVLMIHKGDEEPTPATIVKHAHLIKKVDDIEMVYVAKTLSTFNRKRLIQNKFSFIIPGRQLYLPILAIDIREHIARQRPVPDRLSPSAQAVALYAIYSGDLRGWSQTQLAGKLGYTTMTVSRAFDEFEAASVGQVTPMGREKILRFDSTGKDLWEKVQPMLATPVRKRIFATKRSLPDPGPQAGLSALSRYSDLTEPPSPIYAVSEDQLKMYKEKESMVILEKNDPDPSAIVIEVWKYTPALFQNQGCVDRLSLWLSLRDSSDARVSMALDELMKGMVW